MQVKMLYAVALMAGTIGSLAIAGCGGGDDGGETGDAGPPDPGEYSFEVAGTMDIAFPEPEVSSGSLSLQAAETGDVSGSGTLDILEGGEFSLGDLSFSLAIKQDGDTVSIDFKQSKDRPSNGTVGPDSATVDLNVDAELSTGESAANPDPLHLELDGLLQTGEGDEALFAGTAQTPFVDPGAPDATVFVIDEAALTWTFTPPGEAPPTAPLTPTETPVPDVTLPSELEGFLGLMGVSPDEYDKLFFETDPEGDHIYGDPDEEPGFTPGYTDLTGYFAAGLSVSQETADALDAMLACESSFGDNETVCPEGADPYPAGSALIFGGIYEEAVPLDPDRSCSYALIVDTATPWQAQDPFTFDFYQGGGGWHEILGDPGAPWIIALSVVNEQQEPQDAVGDTRGFIFRDLNLVAFVLPADELLGATGWRVTADCNMNFDPPESGGDVPGADPTGGLISFPPMTDFIVTGDPVCDTEAFATCP